MLYLDSILLTRLYMNSTKSKKAIKGGSSCGGFTFWGWHTVWCTCWSVKLFCLKVHCRKFNSAVGSPLCRWPCLCVSRWITHNACWQGGGVIWHSNTGFYVSSSWRMYDLKSLAINIQGEVAIFLSLHGKVDVFVYHTQQLYLPLFPRLWLANLHGLIHPYINRVLPNCPHFSPNHGGSIFFLKHQHKSKIPYYMAQEPRRSIFISLWKSQILVISMFTEVCLWNYLWQFSPLHILTTYFTRIYFIIKPITSYMATFQEISYILTLTFVSPTGHHCTQVTSAKWPLRLVSGLPEPCVFHT